MGQQLKEDHSINTFKKHINILTPWKQNWHLLTRFKACISQNCTKQIVQSTFLFNMFCGDIIYIQSAASILNLAVVILPLDL